LEDEPDAPVINQYLLIQTSIAVNKANYQERLLPQGGSKPELKQLAF
jgi:hypothetical protein